VALSQEQLAERAGLSARAVSDLERGIHRTPHLGTVRLLADALALDDAGRASLLAAARSVPVEVPVARSRLGSLPAPLTRLVGRERELATLATLLRDDAVRLLTLTGPGGSGKTRLAIAVAGILGDTFPHSVVFVDLAPLADPALVLPTIAQAVGLKTQGTVDLTEALRSFLIGQRLLLILDNFEHLLASAPLVADLLSGLPSLKVLATSREPLRLRGEREFQVPPLSLPDPKASDDPARLAENEAVTLFVERALDARADFTLTEHNAPTIAAICRRLDGLPLALELAAARVRGLPLLTLHGRLEQSLPLLTGGARDAPKRQRSLRDTIAWSHELLSSEEQTLFRRLGVFAGGWSLEAAEAVLNADGDLDVLEGLTSLAEKTLVQLDESGVAPRYRMLETVREYALEQLGRDSGGENAVRRAHATHFAGLVITAESGLASGVIADVARVEADLDNLRSTLAWLLDAGDGETALRMAGSLSQYWTFAGGHFAEGHEWLERALMLGATVSPAARAVGHLGIAVMALNQADLVTARAAATAGLAVARSAGDARRVAETAYVLGSVEGSEGRHAEAMTLALEAEAAAREAGDPGVIGWSLHLLGVERHAAGDLEGAVSELEEALELFRTTGGRWGEVATTERLGLTTRAQGDLHRAAALYGQALALGSEGGAGVGILNELIGLADLARRAGNLNAAALLLGAAGANEVRSGHALHRERPAIRDHTQATVKEHLGPTDYRRAWERGYALSPGDAIAEALAIAATLSAGSSA
jgi:predicted ATPase/DNA-binding XRE family transcriptional regulator